MAKPFYEVVMQVQQPYHGADGEVLYEPGQQFPQDAAGLPDDLRLIPVVVESAAKGGKDEPVKSAKPAPKHG